MKPSPSVLKDLILLFCRIKVLAQPHSEAEASCSSAKLNACSLRGIVIFAPKPFFEKKLLACVSKCSTESGSIVLY